MTDYKIEIEDSGDKHYTNRILIGTATTGLVRIEWVQGRYGQLIPINWSQVQYIDIIPGYYPLQYLVADAQNLIVQVALERDFTWCLLWEHDTIPEPDALMKINKYMRDKQVPVVSGLYYTRSRPSEPLIFKGRGTGSFTDFKRGDLVWCDGIPMGFSLIHCSILAEMAKDSETYFVKNKPVKRIFETPREYIKYENGDVNTVEGTSDLNWCSKVIEGKYFEKAGWKEYQDMEFPFLVDTSIFCRHIDPDGTVFP